MKRTLLITLVILLAFGAGFAGDKVAKKLKFPYAGEKWNKEVAMTKLELACAEKWFESAEPIPCKLQSEKKAIVFIKKIKATANTDGLFIDTEITVADGAGKKLTREHLELAHTTAWNTFQKASDIPLMKRLGTVIYNGKTVAKSLPDRFTTVIDPK